MGTGLSHEIISAQLLLLYNRSRDGGLDYGCYECFGNIYDWKIYL